LKITTTRRRRAIIAVAVLAIAATGVGLSAGIASASHPEVSLAGSNFEIDTDANLRLDDPAPSEDWASIPQGTTPGTERRKADQPTGANDDSFGQGTKEDTAVPSVVDGSIPPNKSDLLNFGAYLETTPSGRRFLNIFWHRVQEPSGTTNMDFEFNKSTTASGNGVTPVRTAGDVLIQYDLAQGGTHPELFLSRWVTSGPKSQCVAANSTPCWGNTTASGLAPRVNLSTAGLATGSINTSTIPVAQSDGLATDITGDGIADPVSPRTFGEAQLDFDALAAGGTDPCVSFGSAYLKSRSSDSFTAALKDFIAPLATNFNTCGKVHIIKNDDNTPPALLDGAQFNLVADAAPVNNAGGPGAEDTVVTGSCTTVAGVCDIDPVQQGEYWVVETVAPPGHDLPTPVYQHITVVSEQTVTVTFVDPRQRGAIQVTKTRKHAADGTGPHPQAGVTFNIGGTTAVTDANGHACVDGFLFGSYDVTETVPAGYVADGATTKSVTVDNKAFCTDSPYVGETVAFGNTPLTNVTVSVDSQVDGGTASTITCGSASASTGPNGDGSLVVSDLQPQTLTCTVVIDP
jgi:hypothetical protein